MGQPPTTRTPLESGPPTTTASAEQLSWQQRPLPADATERATERRDVPSRGRRQPHPRRKYSVEHSVDATASCAGLWVGFMRPHG